jgi:transcriptional regulator with XRE-family HTH domain
LSASLDPAVVRFVVQLRQLKDDSQLTLPRLAAKSGFSASSWERYLGGRALTPFPAVEALAAIVGGDQVRITALYEAAADAWRSQESDTAASVSQPEEPDDQSLREPPAEPAVKPADGLRSRRFLRTALTASAGAVAGAAIALLAMEPIHASTNAAPARQDLLVTKRVAYTCTYTRIQNGQWYAGNSTTSTDVLEVDMWGPEVAELQCLLQRAGISPGGIDGHFGPLTETAVIKEQKALHLDIDGQVGPHTWAALRK